MAESYEKAGVNLEAGYEVVRRIKKHVASTSRLGVMGNIGAFGGMFDLSALNVKEPVLVSGTDGVGTKLKLAFEMDKHDTIGIDAVAMCVNDVLAQGAEPLFFLDYVAVGQCIRSRHGIVLFTEEGLVYMDGTNPDNDWELKYPIYENDCYYEMLRFAYRKQVSGELENYCAWKAWLNKDFT